MTSIMVTGGAGQLATAMAQEGGAVVRRVGRPVFDFDRPASIAETVQAVRPAFLVNAAAWTAVDAAEADPDAAGRANRDGPATLAALCADAGIPLIHISTDYVFDGSKGAPYTEADPTSPTGVYGATKLEGEQAVLAACPRAVVLRTSWVYSAVGKNFVRTMLGAALKTDRLRVVADQQGCPTAARDLAVAVLAIVARLREGWDDRYAGVLHAAGAGSATWHGFAEAVFQEAARYGHPTPTVEPIATAEWPTPAQRPADSRLDCAKLSHVFDVRLPEWRSGLSRTVAELLAAAPPGR